MKDKNRKYRTAGKIMDYPGIYLITNTHNGNVYVGQSKSISDRVVGHFQSLRRGKHSNPYMQNSYNKHGEDAYVVSVLEYVKSFEDLNDREQYWINTLKPDYNILLDVIVPGVPMLLARHNDIPEMFPSTFDECIDYLVAGETYQRPSWHAWVYGGSKNPLLNRR